MRSVTHMFDRLITWFTPERRARTLLAVEVGSGAFFTSAMVLNQAWGGGFVPGVLSLMLALSLGVGVATHRTRPHWAVAALCVSVFVGLLGTALFSPPSSALVFVAAAVITFGSSAYGKATARWIGLALSVMAAVGLLLVFVIGAGLYVNVSLGYVLARMIELLIWPVIILMPWVLGELVRSIRNRRALSAAVETVSTERDAALTRADLEAERTRVARDVHDIVAHSLTVVIAQADGARYATMADSPAAADAFGTIAQTARDALADVRTLLTELRHTQEAGPQPGIQNLDVLVDSFRDSGLTLTVHEFGDRGGLTDARELALYRIVQESLTNALRHGDGAATLDLDWGDAAVDLLLTNVAAAPAPASADAAVAEVTHGEFPPERGHGIDGMRERAILAGGEFSIREGTVFRVRARLPREPREPSQPEPATPDTIDTEVLA